MPIKPKISSLENSSVLRKFTILFILISILPLVVLFYFYVQIQEHGRIEIAPATLNLTLTFVVLGILLGYGTLRSILKSIVDISRTSTETLREVLGEDKIREIANNNNEVAVLARSFSEITNRLEDNIRNLETTKKTLQSVITKVGHGISSMQDINSFLELILETIAEALSAKGGVLMAKDPANKDFFVRTIFGIPYEVGKKPIRLEDGAFSPVILTGKPMMIPKMYEGEAVAKEYGIMFETPVLCAPLLLHDKILGIICVSGRTTGGKSGNFSEEEMNLLFNIGIQTAIALENAKLNSDAEKTYFETISALAMAVEAKDQYSRGHLDRVADYCEKIARKLNLSDADIKVLKDGARLHDLGKIGILDDVLKKPTSLNAQEWEMMKKHTEIGEGIIKPVQSLAKLSDVIRHHHEKLDGTGYPDGLKGTEISLLTRILSVADVFDALTTDRPYRKAFSFEEAKKELSKMKGQLDPAIVDLLLEIVSSPG